MVRKLLNSAVKAYKEGGVKTLINRSYLKFLGTPPVPKIITSISGELFYERLRLLGHLGYWPKIKNPRSFNEKINHRKFFTNNEKFAHVEDKYKVRNYVKERVGEEILPKLYHVTKDPETIPFQELPEKFVIKANHGCGWNIIVENKEEADKDEIRKKCREWLNQKYDHEGHQYWYWDIEPKIIVEEYIETPRESLRDYKFFVFDGGVEYIQVDMDRHQDHKRRIYDKDWNPQEFELNYRIGPVTEKPPNLGKMKDFAEKLGKEFDFIRVDFYNPEKEDIVFGELTVGHGRGQERFRPKKYDFKVGEYWKIDN